MATPQQPPKPAAPGTATPAPVHPVTTQAPAPVQPQTSTPPATNPLDVQPPFGGHAMPAQPAPSAPQQPPDAAVRRPPNKTDNAGTPRVREDDADEEDTVLTATAESYRMPPEFEGKPGAELLLKVCDLFGVDPNPKLPTFVAGKHVPTANTKFRELLNWRFYPGDPDAGMPDKVTIVTAGGRKLTVDSNGEFDSDTETILRHAFRAFKMNPKTNEPEPMALPGDLTLPVEAVLGIVMSDEHVYRRGYLGEGGKREADRRDARVAARKRAFQA